MPNGQAKLKFDAEFEERCQQGIYAAQAFYRAINRRILSRVNTGQLSQCVRVFQEIKDYGAEMVGKKAPFPLPYWDKNPDVSKRKTDLQIVRNAKEALKGLFDSVNAVKRIGLKDEYSHALELLNWMDAYLTGMAGNV